MRASLRAFLSSLTDRIGSLLEIGHHPIVEGYDSRLSEEVRV